MKSCRQTHDFMYNIFDHSWTEKKEWNHVFRHMISLLISDCSLTADYICQQSVSERCLNKNILTAVFLSVKMCVNCMCIADKAWNLPIYVLLWIYVRHLEVTANTQWFLSVVYLLHGFTILPDLFIKLQPASTSIGM